MPTIRFLLLILISLLWVSFAHAQGVWNGYLSPDESAPTTSTIVPRIFLQNLSEDERRIANEAAVTVEAVLNHPAFAQLMSQENPRVTCSEETKEPGSDILERLLTETVAFSLVARKPSNIALAEFSNRRVAIMPARFEGWDMNDEAKGKMIATLIHEMTHMVPSEAGNYSRYTDNRPWRNMFCKKPKLASYRVTSVVNEFWLRHQDEILVSAKPNRELP